MDQKENQFCCDNVIKPYIIGNDKQIKATDKSTEVHFAVTLLCNDCIHCANILYSYIYEDIIVAVCVKNLCRQDGGNIRIKYFVRKIRKKLLGFASKIWKGLTIHTCQSPENLCTNY